MTPSRERQLINGVWQYVTAEENGGGSLPDPSGEPDGDVLTVASGAAVWSPGGGSQPITRAQYDLALADVPTDTATKLPFAFNYGTELLDLTDTTDPTPVESGTYSFAVTVAIANVAAGARWGVSVTLDEDDFAGSMGASEEITGVTGAQTITFPFYVPAGSPCHVKVDHNDSDGADFSGHVYVQRLS